MVRVSYAPGKECYGEEEIQAVVDSLRAGWLAPGERVKEFETKIAKRFGKKYGVMVGSGSQANLLAGEETDAYGYALTPALTFTTTLSSIYDRAILVDVEEGTYQADFSKVSPEEIDFLDQAFVPNLLGNIPDWSKLPSGLGIIEDSCDTITDAGKKVSDIATTSFYASHVITTAGAGGMIMTNDKEEYETFLSKRAWGRPVVAENDLKNRFREIEEGLIYDTKFTYDYIGYNFQPTEVQAAFGLAQLQKLDDILAKRKSHFDRLYAFFKQYEDRFILPITREGANWLAFPLTIREGVNRTDFAGYLEKNNIQTRPIFSGNITRQPAYKEIFTRKDFPVADKIMKDGILLGMHHGLEDEHLTYLEETCQKYLSSH